MNYMEIRKLSLKVFLGFLGLTALVAIVSVLIGEFGELQGKILITCFTISIASIFVMSCAVFIEKKKLVLLGMSGIALSVSAAVLTIVCTWLEFNSDEYWKVTFTCWILAVSLTLAFLLSLPAFDRYKWVQPISAVTIGILALQGIVAIWGEIDDELYYRIFAVVAIIVALEVLVIPILTRIQKTASLRKEKLVLEKIDEGLYRDSAGNEYELKKTAGTQNS